MYERLGTFPPSGSKYVTASADTRKPMMDRPTSRFQRVIDKFSALSGLSGGIDSPGLDRSNYESTPDGQEEDEEFGTCFVVAKKLQTRLNKIQRIGTSLLKAENEFQADLSAWSNHVNGDLSKVVLKEMANVLSAQRKAEISLLNRQQEIIQLLANVAEKEKLKKRFFDDRIKLKNNQIRIVNDYGEKSTKAEKIQEQLESNYCNLQVLETHYTKAITQGLKNAFADYSLTLQSIGANLEDSARMYDELVRAAEMEASRSKNSPTKRNIHPNDLEEPLRLSENNVNNMESYERPICVQCSNEAGRSMPCKQPKYHQRRNVTNDGISRKPYPASGPRPEADTITLKGLNLGNYNSNESWA